MRPTKISKNFDSRSVEDEIEQQRRYRRGFDGNLQLVNRGGETFSQRVINNTGATKRVAFFGGIFQNVDELNTVLGEKVNLLYGGNTSVASLTVSNQVQTRLAQRHFSRNPSRIARMEVMVDANHQSQLNNPVTIRTYSPTRNAGSIDKNLQVEVRPTNFMSNKAVLHPDSQLDDQTIYIIDVLDGSTVDITYVLGANINTAAALFKATRGVDDEL